VRTGVIKTHNAPVPEAHEIISRTVQNLIVLFNPSEILMECVLQNLPGNTRRSTVVALSKVEAVVENICMLNSYQPISMNPRHVRKAYGFSKGKIGKKECLDYFKSRFNIQYSDEADAIAQAFVYLNDLKLLTIPDIDQWQDESLRTTLQLATAG
jgi:Holliday junction resolvasome RuvABC endonuclease subunit